ncbi:2-amino-4-hydroxy-6-hydroxymethyldihydropteridine diphosphokinase [Thiobacillus sp.]|uniref:2-amino-4-hydroxy-6- hydroxymethyldihydropteridine diphosphokinase n=1 Tax=Thiobacillus sp. TaxID=924 RepID=UPI0017BCB34B|nr:2-amino-4-hydroxy-6-hydroxymethyldihydropteridine diphosphokinase [Thiobacillus sp.]MBC2732427.1 2-amino-4-hydroxy-6-hydroxymethyldihydropteridine diphosphokinase [Thiobacillus sp.]MBC2741165.1 2-amino-4-hydroxy-6-hydroxymethyldihydropteridine diphosphokinase [Thiobacillus sp.]MBC2759856.1 2-amino-4-hydroxy-6-hydroxymethyldihydropteridine diphosphokinase [Thiobacillus sp.]MBD3812495.1 2-amino-4-hydroxy-6-hydroxymethyldihydropteridine diphosphokinase [Betaproteobacteria bacterium]
MSRAFVALGGNVGGPAARLLTVMGEFDSLPHTRLVRASSLYRTAPVGYADQPDFINAVVLLETGLSPDALMDELLAMETRHGRVRHVRNGPRTLDLDLLLYDGLVLDGDPALIVPHPRLHLRSFVLAPLVEIAPECVLPRHGRAASLLERMTDRDEVRRIDFPGLDDGLQVLRRLGQGLMPHAYA